mgnify:CR=1 FL=1
MQKFPLKYEDIDLYFDPVKHVYKVNGKNVRSVTGVTSEGVPKKALTDWLVNTPMAEAKSQLNKLLDEGKKLDRVTLERVFLDSSQKTEKIKVDAGLVGTVVHGLVEDYLKGKELPEQTDKKVIACWNTFIKWWDKQEYTPVEIEKKIYSKNYNYAGTLDLVVKDKEGKLVLIDVKTSNGIKRWQELKTKGLASEQVCKNKLKRKINFNMKKYEKGEWSSRSQAIAVSYSQIKKSHPMCKTFF